VEIERIRKEEWLVWWTIPRAGPGREEGEVVSSERKEEVWMEREEEVWVVVWRRGEKMELCWVSKTR